VRVGLTKGLEAGLALEAREFGVLVASDDGRGGIDRFLARRSLPLPARSSDMERLEGAPRPRTVA
jgi:hypothetical protein